MSNDGSLIGWGASGKPTDVVSNSTSGEFWAILAHEGVSGVSYS